MAEYQMIRWRPIEEGIRMALIRKRRMRLIYKWRHGLDHTHQPANRDRGKYEALAFWQWLRTPMSLRGRMYGSFR